MPDWRRACLGPCLGLALGLIACADTETPGDTTQSRPPELQRLVEEARLEMEEGNLAEAGRLFDAALATDRVDPGLWVDIARLRFRGGEHTGALEASEFALSLDREFAPALLLRAQLVRDAYGLEAALRWFEAALALHPRDADLLAEYAATLGDLGRHRDMLAAVRDLAEVDASDPRVHYLQAVLALRAGEPVLASSLLKRSGMVDRGVPAALVADALADLQQGTFDTAASSLERLLERQPGNAVARDLLARALWLGGRDREIVDRFAARVSAPDASPYLTMLVGRAYERLGERAMAAPLIERALAFQTGEAAVLPAPNGNPDGLPDQTFAMRQFVNSAPPGEAERYAGELLRQFPESSDIAALAGDAALWRGDPSGALSLYGRAAEVRRPWPLSRKMIHAFRQSGDTAAADALLLRQLRAEPRNAEALIMLAQRSAEDDDWLRVAVLLDHVIEIGAGNDLEVLELRLRSARALDDEASIARFASALAKLGPGDFAPR
ncbi:tetratricopeptide repeat protein [Erythrobacter sp. GH1-10]|uniref:tetratricopeptide repeat protein n=1 Tax=Erythrobacter sp. GH1-10 TaxID=3349334 RepID=UPI003877FFE1